MTWWSRQSRRKSPWDVALASTVSNLLSLSSSVCACSGSSALAGVGVRMLLASPPELGLGLELVLGLWRALLLAPKLAAKPPGLV